LRLPVPLRMAGVEKLASWAEAGSFEERVPRPAPAAPVWAKLKPVRWASGSCGPLEIVDWFGVCVKCLKGRRRRRWD